MCPEGKTQFFAETAHHLKSCFQRQKRCFLISAAPWPRPNFVAPRAFTHPPNPRSTHTFTARRYLLPILSPAHSIVIPSGRSSGSFGYTQNPTPGVSLPGVWSLAGEMFLDEKFV